MPALRSLPESRILRGMQSIFRVTPEGDSVAAYLEQLEQGEHVNLPTGASNIRVVYEAFNVYGQLLRLKARSDLLAYLTESPDQVCLIVDDCAQDSKEGLFLAQWLPDIDHITRWLNRLTIKSIYVNSVGQESVVIAPLRVFALC